jgi:hypothetical protein
MALQRAVEALLAYPMMGDPGERQTVVSTLDPRVTAVLRRHSKARTDVVNILGELTRRNPEVLWDLFDAVVSVDDDPELKAELSAALNALVPPTADRREPR